MVKKLAVPAGIVLMISIGVGAAISMSRHHAPQVDATKPPTSIDIAAAFTPPKIVIAPTPAPLPAARARTRCEARRGSPRIDAAGRDRDAARYQQRQLDAARHDAGRSLGRSDEELRRAVRARGSAVADRASRPDAKPHRGRARRIRRRRSSSHRRRSSRSKAKHQPSSRDVGEEGGDQARRHRAVDSPPGGRRTERSSRRTRPR